jgi:hypothetical protein
MIPVLNYSQTLRAIGQDLEARHVKAFDVERQNEDYFVWVRTQMRPPEKSPPLKVGRAVFRKARSRLQRQSGAEKEDLAASAPSEAYQLRYSPEDVDRLEREGRARRRNPNRVPDAHSLSQLLRALGGYMTRRNLRLLAISWREESVSIVYQTDQGRRELDNFRLDSIYDLWVHMYVRRTN